MTLPEMPGAQEPPRTFAERHGISPPAFAVVAIIAIFFIYQLLGGGLVLLLFGRTPSDAALYRIATGLGELLFLLVPAWLAVKLLTPAPAEFLRLRRPGAAALLVPFIGIFALQQMLQIYLVFQDRIPVGPELEQLFTEWRKAVEATYTLLVGSHSVPELLLVVFVIALIPAIAEEILFRGLVLRALGTSMTPLRAVVATGIIFGGYHLYPSQFVPLAAIGIYLGFLAWRGDSLWVSAAAHFYNNAIAVVALYFHAADDFVVTGDASAMSNGMLLLTFWLFGVVFLLANFWFVHLTRRPPAPPSVETPP